MNLAKALKLTEKARLPDWEPDKYLTYCSNNERFIDQDGEVYTLKPHEAMNQKWEVYTGAKDCRHKPIEESKLGDDFIGVCAQCRLSIKPGYWIVA